MSKNYSQKQCKICRDSFSPTTGSKVVCDKEECFKVNRRNNEKSRYYRLKPSLRLVCGICSIEFETTDGKRKYCYNIECYKKSVYLKNKKADEKRKDKHPDYLKLKYQKNRDVTLEKKRLKYRIENSHRDVVDGHSTTKVSESKVYKLFSDEKYSIKDLSSYVNTHSKIEVICPFGHDWEVSYHNFKGSKNSKGHRCPKCQPLIKQSYPELQIIDYFKDNYNLNIIECDRFILGKLELDIVFPDHNLAIEYCGLRWHGELFSGKPRMYHRSKMELCNEKGIRLITIFEDEYLNNKEAIISRVASALGLSAHKVYARNCILKEVSSKISSEFFSRHHLQGKTGQKVTFGLYHGDTLVQAMSFGNVSRTHAGGKEVIELKRLASIPGYNIVGGASKLFSQAKKWSLEHGYSTIKSYCDMRWANPFRTIYSILGFQLKAETKYTPHYFKGQKRYRNQSLRKTPEERLTGKTEWQLRQEQGFDRIWDCGHRTYVYNLK